MRGKKLRNQYLTFDLCVCSSSQLWWRWSIWGSVWLRHQWPLCGSGKGSLSQSEWADMKQFWGKTQTNSVCCHDETCLWVNEPFGIKSHSTVKKNNFVFFSLDLSMYIFSLAEVLQKTVMHILSPFCKYNVHSLISSFTFVAKWPAAHFL